MKRAEPQIEIVDDLIPAVGPEPQTIAGTQTQLVYRSFNPATDQCSDGSNVIIYQNNPSFPEGMHVCSGGTYQPLNLATLGQSVRDVSCRLQFSANQPCTNNGFQILSWTIVNYDTDGMYNAGAPDRMTIKTAGKYLIEFLLNFDGISQAGARWVYLLVNGAPIFSYGIGAAQTGNLNTALQGNAVFNLAPTDIVQLEVNQDSGVTSSVQGTANTGAGLGRPFFTVSRIA